MELATTFWLGAAAIGVTALLYGIVRVYHARRQERAATVRALAEYNTEVELRNREANREYVRTRREQIERENVERRARQLAERAALHANWDAVKARMPDRTGKGGNT